MADANKIRLVNVRKVLQRVVAYNVVPAVHGAAAHTRLHVVFPGLAGLLYLEGNVVAGEGHTGGRGAVVVGKDLSRRHDLIVADRRMGVCPILGGQPVLIRK